MAPFRILTVCTANICRSPASASLLRVLLNQSAPDATVTLESAGVYAGHGAPACTATSELVTGSPALSSTQLQAAQALQGEHQSRPLRAAPTGEIDLLLPLDRTHRSVLAQQAPDTRPRTFTLRQAATLAGVVADQLRAGQFPDGAPPLPPKAKPEDRLRWFVGEMDAARGIGPLPEPSEEFPDTDPLDVPDPHEIGFQLHPNSYKMVEAACLKLASALTTVTEMPDPEYASGRDN